MLIRSFITQHHHLFLFMSIIFLIYIILFYFVLSSFYLFILLFFLFVCFCFCFILLLFRLLNLCSSLHLCIVTTYHCVIWSIHSYLGICYSTYTVSGKRIRTFATWKQSQPYSVRALLESVLIHCIARHQCFALHARGIAVYANHVT